jgi:hypothetical protein
MWRAVELASKDARKITKHSASKSARSAARKKPPRVPAKKRILKRKLG